MLRNYIARCILSRAIKAHENNRWSIAHSTGYPGVDIGWQEYVENTPDIIWHLVSCEYRCIERLKKLLIKYQ